MMARVPDLAAVRAGGKAGLARALALIETAGTSPDLAALLDNAARSPRGEVIGLTGPPGAGKSTLINALIRAWRGIDLSVGVIAVDPSSRLTGGALLGDRTRMRTDPEDEHVFVRSMAARDRLGGLSEHAVAAVVLMRAVFDRVIVETVGVGQSEGDVATVADTVVLLIQPGSGDALQFMKAGIMELPDVVAVTKADMGAVAIKARADVEGALSLAAEDGWTPPVVLVGATVDVGIAELLEAIALHARACSERREAARRRQEQAWLVDAVRTEFGRRGLEGLDLAAILSQAPGPFEAMRRILAGLSRLKARLILTRSQGYQTVMALGRGAVRSGVASVSDEPFLQWKDLPIAFLVAGVAVAGGVLAARVTESDRTTERGSGTVVARTSDDAGSTWFNEFSDLQQSFAATRLKARPDAVDVATTGSVPAPSVKVVRTTPVGVPVAAPVVASASAAVMTAPGRMPTASAMAFGGLAPAPWLKITVTGAGTVEAAGAPGRQKTAAIMPKLKSSEPETAAATPVLAYANDPPAVEGRFKSLFADGDDGLTARTALKLPKNLHTWAYTALPATVTLPRHQKCLAEAIYFESRGENERGQAAVAQVVLNRVRNPAYPDNICDVVYQQESQRDHCQFSFACDGRKEVVNEPEAWKRAVKIAADATAGKLYDPEVADATHYHASWVRPDWKNTMKRVAVIGVHRFYRTMAAAGFRLSSQVLLSGYIPAANS